MPRLNRLTAVDFVFLARRVLRRGLMPASSAQQSQNAKDQGQVISIHRA